MAWFNPGHGSDSPGGMGERIQQVTVRKFVGWDKNSSLSGAWESLIPSAESPQVPEAAGKWPSAECSARSPHGRGWQGICWQSHSQAAWNQMEKLVNYCERCLPELLHIQCKREGIKINRVYSPYSVPGNLGFYQVQNPANFTIGHLFISYKVAWKNLSACLSSHPWLLSQASWILKVFIANYSDPFLSHFLQKIHTNILITGYLPGTFSFTKYHYTNQSQCYNWYQQSHKFKGFGLKSKIQQLWLPDSGGELSLTNSRWGIHFQGTHSNITLHAPQNQIPFNVQIHMKEKEKKNLKKYDSALEISFQKSNFGGDKPTEPSPAAG